MEFEDSAMSFTSNSAVVEMIEKSRRALDLVEDVSRAKVDRGVKQQNKEALILLIQSLVLDAERMLAIKETEPKPPCWYCGQSQTPTESDLERHIETTAQGAGWSGWQRDEFVAKMRPALGIGDRITWIGPGSVQVRRRDGRIETVYRRDG